MAHAVLGVAVGLVWLVLPLTTVDGGGAAHGTRAGPTRSVTASAPSQTARDESSSTSLVLPLVVVVAAGVISVLAYVRRTRRARSRTTPAAPGAVSAEPPVPSLTVLDEQTLDALVQADDCVRTSREELGFAAEVATDTEPFSHAVRDAEVELAAAFRIRQRYDAGVPADEPSRRHTLAGIVGRCAEAGRRLDTVAVDFDRLRAPRLADGKALRAAEKRFRGLATRIAATPAALAAAATRHPASATVSVAGYVEQAKDRLVFATLHLNDAHQAADTGNLARAARQLRAAEGAVAHGEILTGAVSRLAGELDAAATLVPASLTGAEAELAGLRGTAASGTGDAIRLARADAALAAVREELASGRPYDSLDALRSVVRAVTPLMTGQPGNGVLSAAAALTARSALADAEDYVATHLAAVGGEARTRLAEAVRLAGGEEVSAQDAAEALTLALAARELAERDVGAYGAPLEGPGALGGAVLSGVLLGEEPDGGPPPSYGGPGTRRRRRLPGTDDRQR